MKADWLKAHWLQLVFGIATAGILGFGAWGWHSTQSKNSQLLENLQQLEDKKRNLTTPKPDVPRSIVAAAVLMSSSLLARRLVPGSCQCVAGTG